MERIFNMKLVKLKVYSDYAWPFCYIGKGIVEQLSKTYPLEIEWIGYELHPETPKEGVLVTEEFPDLDMENMLTGLNATGAPFGIRFNPFEKMPNTQLALAASEFARDNGKFEEFNGEIFKAIFVDGLDIGQLETVLSCAKNVGLEPTTLEKVLKEEKYLSRLDEGRRSGKKYKIAGLPTFIINEDQKIVGIQPYESFVQALEGVQKKSQQPTQGHSCGINGCEMV